MLGADHRPAHDEAAQGGLQQHVHQALANGGHAGGRQPIGDLGPGQRSVRGEGTGDDGNAPISRLRRYPLLSQASGVGRRERRDSEGLQPGVVLAADQVQGAAVDPGDHQGPVFGQRPVHIGGRYARRAGADRQPETAGILTLDGQ